MRSFEGFAIFQLYGKDGMEKSGAAFEPFVKENDEQTDYGNNAKNDESYSEGVHLDTSIPSRR